MYSFKTKNQTFAFKTESGVFFPTDTSELIISGSRKIIKQPGKLLDLGCGIGVLGIVLNKLGLTYQPIYASDLSENAIDLAKQNAKSHGCEMIAKNGALFDPWGGEKFDIIVDDVPGISEEISAYSSWFPEGVPFAPGPDGTELVCRVVENASEYLEEGGTLIFPVLSLSNVEKIILCAKKNFKYVERVSRKMWALPDQMKPHMDALRKLEKEKKIFLEEKFGMVLWYTEIYAVRN